MHRLIVATLLALTLLVGFLPTTSAETADWDMSWFAQGQVHMFYTINTNSLQVDSFTCVNNTTQPAVLWIEEAGVEIFRLRCAGGESITQPISNFKFQRVPATDHDDPNSIRYPKDVVMRAGWPAP